jgi:hypothetical protein
MPAIREDDVFSRRGDDDERIDADRADKAL